ncbi:MAG TPA: ABC transporter substrate-binding protein [Candidatus Binatia bacterium]|jgi:NitT/TauT family transport system substrate-binding protein|nr:ABC transporter substrate-binding protein [Candidatus Binatia bacterium]
MDCRRLRQCLALSFLLSAIAAPAAAGEGSPAQPLEKVRIAYSSISGNQVPAWVALEQGFFRKNGLDVELVFIEGGTRAANALLSGDVTFSQMAGPSVLQSNLQGLDVVIIAGFLNTMDYQLMVHKSITRPEQLKGKTLAVSRFGSSSDFATRYALDKYGLVPDKDVIILEIGSQPARFAALEAGKIEGAMVAVPLTLKAKALGFHALADLKMLGLEYQHTALATTRSMIKSKPALVRNALRAFVEAIHYYKTHRKESLAILRKYLKDNDPQDLEETYEAIGLTLIPEKPYPTLRGIQIMLRELSAKDPKARTARPEQFVEMSFLKELDSSGFIDRLYKSQPIVASRETTGRPSPSVTVQEKASPPVTVQEKGPREKSSAKSSLASPRMKSAPTTFVASALPEEYTVQAGDTLSHIAGRFYGSEYKWRKIYQANATTVKNPNFIYIGQPLLIPAD